MVEVNWLAVLIATVASMVVGSIWYGPAFGKVWMKLAKVSEKDVEKGGWTPLVIAIGTSFVLAFVLAHFTYLAFDFYQEEYSFFSTALITAAWAWLGFTALRFLTHDSFEGRSIKLTGLNAAHELVTMLAMAAVIGLMGV